MDNTIKYILPISLNKASKLQKKNSKLICTPNNCEGHKQEDENPGTSVSDYKSNADSIFLCNVLPIPTPGS
jgi:hypothetical protein